MPPDVTAATIFSFIPAMNAHATPVRVCGPTFHTMGQTVYDQFLGLTNRSFGAVLAFVLMTATLLLMVASYCVEHRRCRS